MASSKKLGDYSLKSITATQLPGPAGSVLVQVNWEGTATGFGTVFGTSTFVGGKSGTWSWTSTSYLDNGDTVTGNGHGTYESTGKNKWSTKGIVDNSDGRRTASEGEIVLSARTWRGTLSE